MCNKEKTNHHSSGTHGNSCSLLGVLCILYDLHTTPFESMSTGRHDSGARPKQATGEPKPNQTNQWWAVPL